MPFACAFAFAATAPATTVELSIGLDAAAGNSHMGCQSAAGMVWLAA